MGNLRELKTLRLYMNQLTRCFFGLSKCSETDSMGEPRPCAGSDSPLNWLYSRLRCCSVARFPSSDGIGPASRRANTKSAGNSATFRRFREHLPPHPLRRVGGLEAGETVLVYSESSCGLRCQVLSPRSLGSLGIFSNWSYEATI